MTDPGTRHPRDPADRGHDQDPGTAAPEAFAPSAASQAPAPPAPPEAAVPPEPAGTVTPEPAVAAPSRGSRPGGLRLRAPGPRASAVAAVVAITMGAAGCFAPWLTGPDAARVPAGVHEAQGVATLGTTLGWAGGDARVTLLLLLLALPSVVAWFLGWCGLRQRVSAALAGFAALCWTLTALASASAHVTPQGDPLDVSRGPGGFIAAAGAGLLVLTALTARRDPLSDFLATGRRIRTLWLRGDRVEAVRRNQALLRRGDRTLGERDADVRNLWFVQALMLAELGQGPQAVRAAAIAAARWVDRDRRQATGRRCGPPSPRHHDAGRPVRGRRHAVRSAMAR
ncbi:hypothetical protein ACFXEL_06865 [Streptomyces sp. NPDC059382]|uniref:hypothetical protein n=1 Tax=Streptomyces sp. NPDC059382 TaxID=3346816 RepID=UPI0036C3C46F